MYFKKWSLSLFFQRLFICLFLSIPSIVHAQLDAEGNKSNQDITISSAETINSSDDSNSDSTCEFYNIKDLTISANITVDDQRVVIIRARNITISSGVTINLNSEGQSGGAADTAGSGDGGGNPGGSAASNTGGGAGGSHGGLGGVGGTGGTTSGGAVPGTKLNDVTTAPSFTTITAPNTADDLAAPPPTEDVNAGSGGGGGGGGSGGAGGNGGGKLILYAAEKITVAGTINANGADGSTGGTDFGGGGGGSGGGIVLAAPTVTLESTASITVTGGSGGSGGANVEAGGQGGGGGGSGGRVKLIFDSLVVSGSITTIVSVSGGTAGAGTGGGVAGASGSSGEIYLIPNNFRPAQAVNATPSNSVTVSGNIYVGSGFVTLRSEPFSDTNKNPYDTDWDDHAASQWQVRLSTSPSDYSSTILDTGWDSTNLTSITTPTALPQGTYYFRVRHRDTGDTSGFQGASDELDGVYSSETSFTVDQTGPSAPTLQTPSSNKFIDSKEAITLQWSGATDSASGVKEYDVQVSSKSDFSTIQFSTTTSQTQTQATLVGGEHYWRVRARDNVDNTGSWSSAFKFATEAGVHGGDAPACFVTVAGSDNNFFAYGVPLLFIAIVLIISTVTPWIIRPRLKTAAAMIIFSGLLSAPLDNLNLTGQAQDEEEEEYIITYRDLLVPVVFSGNNMFHALVYVPQLEAGWTLETGKLNGSFRTEFSSLKSFSEFDDSWTAKYDADIIELDAQLREGLGLGFEIGGRIRGARLRAATNKEIILFKGADQYIERSEPGWGAKDFILNLKNGFFDPEEDLFGVSVNGILKIPLAKEDDFLSSRAIDVGGNLAFSYKLEESAIHVNAGLVFPGKEKLFLKELDLSPFFTAGLGFSMVVLDELSMHFQALANSSAFRDVEPLKNPAVTFAVASRYFIGEGFSEFGVSYGLTETAADVVILLGFGMVF